MNHHVCKPAYARWEVRKSLGGTWQVISPTGGVHANFNSRENALTSRDAMEARDNQVRKRVTRFCLCCGDAFESDGIHNRMCNRCRTRNTDGWDPHAIAPRNGRAR